MSRPKPPAPALLSSPDEVEAQFYEALREGHLERLMAVWQDDDDVVCVLPGGTRVCGAASVRQHFEVIFSNGRIPVQPERIRRLSGMGFAVHSVLERIRVPGVAGEQDALAVASNVYVQTPHGWRMVVHHVSPGALDEGADATPPPGGVLH